jgi:polyhydroxyalkanoate synthesis repressor PhaR
MPDAIVIKRYANRRLYDTEQSAYITLEQVTEKVREGKQVRVVDAKSGEDLTAFILSQLIVESARRRNVLLPVPLLHLIVRYGDNLLAEFFEKHLEKTLNTYLLYKGTMDAQFKRWLEMGQDLSDMAQKTFTGLNPFQQLFDSLARPPEGREKGDEEREERDG